MNEHLAAEARRLLSDRTLLHAIAAMRLEALEECATTDPQYPVSVLRAQARVYACDEFLRTLQRHIEAMPSDE
jgi:hypothetical protein